MNGIASLDQGSSAEGRALRLRRVQTLGRDFFLDEYLWSGLHLVCWLEKKYKTSLPRGRAVHTESEQKGRTEANLTRDVVAAGRNERGYR